MSLGLRRFSLLACAVALCGQTPPLQAPQQQPVGLAADWDLAGMLTQISGHAAQLIPSLNKIDARAWIDKGASETYAEQLQSAKAQAQSLADGATALSKSPERLPVALELYFRMQAIDSMLGSVEEGMRKYESPARAQALIRLQAETQPDRERLQRYIQDLAAEREQELRVMDQEAQRCRGALTAPPNKTGKKKQ